MACIAKAEYIALRDIDGISFVVERTGNSYGTITSIEINTIRLFQDVDIRAFSVEFSNRRPIFDL